MDQPSRHDHRVLLSTPAPRRTVLSAQPTARSRRLTPGGAGTWRVSRHVPIRHQPSRGNRGILPERKQCVSGLCAQGGWHNHHVQRSGGRRAGPVSAPQPAQRFVGVPTSSALITTARWRAPTQSLTDVTHEFHRSRMNGNTTTTTSFDVPGSVFTFGIGISPTKDFITGDYLKNNITGPFHGFVRYANGNITRFEGSRRWHRASTKAPILQRQLCRDEHWILRGR